MSAARSFAAGETGTRCRADAFAPNAAAAPATVSPSRAAPRRHCRAARGGKAGGPHWRARRPACDRRQRLRDARVRDRERGAGRRRRGRRRVARRRARRPPRPCLPRRRSVTTPCGDARPHAETSPCSDSFHHAAERRARASRRSRLPRCSRAVAAGAVRAARRRPSPRRSTRSWSPRRAAPQPIADLARRRHGDRRARRSRAAARRASPSCCSGSPASRSSRTAAGRDVRRVPARRERGQTLVLVDGLRVGSSTVGATTLEAIPLDQIERIEILRGPASSLYGADAIGGVIQVFTRRGGRRLAANASAGYGTYDTRDRQRRACRGTRGRVALSRCRPAARRSDGFNAIVNPANFSYNPDRDGYATANVGANVGVHAGRTDQELGAQYFRNRLDNQFDGGAGFDDRTITTLEAWQVDEPQPAHAARGRRRSRPARAATTPVSQTGVRRLSVPDARSGSTRGRTTSRCRPARCRSRSSGARSALDDRRRVRGHARATPTRSIGVYQLRARRPGAAGEPAPRRFDASTAARRPARSPGASASRRGWRVTAGYGTAFKAPTFNDLYFPGFSNPDLAPETSRNVEAGVVLDGRSGRRAHRRARDRLPQPRARADRVPVRRRLQLRAAERRPRDARGRHAGGSTRAGAARRSTASLDLQSPTDDATGQPAAAPRAHARRARGAAAGRARCSVGAELVASSLRYDDAANTRADGRLRDRQPHRRVGGRANGVTLFVRGDNVFDKRLRARRRLLDRRRAACSRACAGSR